MKKPRDASQTPPGMWRYKHPVTGYEFSGAHSMSRIVAMVQEYNQSNNHPPIPNLGDQIIAYICELEPAYCVSTEPPTPAEKARNFLYAAKNWVASGFKHVSQAQFEKRLAICNGCEWWRGESIFGLGSCGNCSCTGLKLYLPDQRCPIGKWEKVPY